MAPGPWVLHHFSRTFCIPTVFLFLILSGLPVLEPKTSVPGQWALCLRAGRTEQALIEREQEELFSPPEKVWQGISVSQRKSCDNYVKKKQKKQNFGFVKPLVKCSENNINIGNNKRCGIYIYIYMNNATDICVRQCLSRATADFMNRFPLYFIKMLHKNLKDPDNVWNSGTSETILPDSCDQCWTMKPFTELQHWEQGLQNLLGSINIIGHKPFPVWWLHPPEHSQPFYL